MRCLGACKKLIYVGYLQKERITYSVAPIFLALEHFFLFQYILRGKCSKDHALGNPVLKSHWNYCLSLPCPLSTRGTLSSITR